MHIILPCAHSVLYIIRILLVYIEDPHSAAVSTFINGMYYNINARTRTSYITIKCKYSCKYFWRSLAYKISVLCAMSILFWASCCCSLMLCCDSVHRVLYLFHLYVFVCIFLYFFFLLIAPYSFAGFNKLFKILEKEKNTVYHFYFVIASFRWYGKERARAKYWKTTNVNRHSMHLKYVRTEIVTARLWGGNRGGF